jgi:HEAT repeat protein/S1-C subfamily serine protease
MTLAAVIVLVSASLGEPADAKFASRDKEESTKDKGKDRPTPDDKDGKGEDKEKNGKDHSGKPPPPPPPIRPGLDGEEIYKRLLKSTVYIVSVITAPDGRYLSRGTGVLVDEAERLVITNEHVANDSADSIAVMFPVLRSGSVPIKDPAFYDGQISKGKGIPVKLVRVERKRDLALLQLESLPEGVAPLRLAAESASPGQAIYSLGAQPKGSQGMWQNNPGVVRQVAPATWRYRDGFERGCELIQSNMAINPGDSGGPVVNNRCALVGVNALSDPEARLVTGHIDLTEVRDLLKVHFRALGRDWSEPPEATEGSGTAAIEKLVKDLDSDDAEVRRKAALSLAERGRDARRAVPPLLKLLRRPGEPADVRAQVEVALSEIGTPQKNRDSVAVLTEALQDMSCPSARAYAAEALGKMETFARAALPALVAALKDPETEVRRNASAALGKIGLPAREAAYAELLAVLQDRDEEVRRTAKGALLQLGDPAPADRPRLATTLGERTGSREGRIYAAAGLGALGEESIPSLLDALANDPDPEVASVACFALGYVGAKNKEVAQALTKALDHRERWVQVSAASVLGQFGVNEDTLPGLLKAMGSADVECRCRKAACYKLPLFTVFTSQPPQYHLSAACVEDLKAGLASDQPIARWFAAYALGTLGNGAAAAVPELGKAIEKEARVKPREGQTYNPVQLEMLMAVAEIGPRAKELAPVLKDLADSAAAPRRTQTCAALAFVPFAATDDEKKMVYGVLVMALLPEKQSAREPVDNELQERAKKALQKGGKLASKAMYDKLQAEFNGLGPEREAARLNCYELWQKMGTTAIDKSDKKFSDSLKQLLTAEAIQGERSTTKNQQMALAARIAIFGK